VKLVPDWFPFAGFKRAAKRMYDDRQRMYDMPFEFVQQTVVRLLSCQRMGELLTLPLIAGYRRRSSVVHFRLPGR
jgi:hypothetical protein